ncbi:MAG: neutral/alkaline non-lysosomal ceramidase N-terminal domain-containing protein [Candidatus Hydrogenedentes bacterium]|nr:neutral/alkaline non-lysosomal ceramidase N-terminal domain-containing protein [Candidatus Hydrogenedentota bacterium]
MHITRREFIAASAIAAATATTNVGGETVRHSGMMAGVAIRDITPAPGVPMWGYSDRKGPSTGTLDPLHARTVVFRTGDTSIAIVTMDLGRTPRPAVLDKIREKAKAAGVTHCIFTASHTHGGPIMELDDAPHVLAIAEKLAESISEAAGKLQPVNIGIGSTLFDISHNRRLIMPDGSCEMLWRNENKRPTNPVDYEATIVKLDATDGKQLAILVHFACHPVVLAGDNLEYSADYVGEMCRIVKEKSGAECLFLQGGCGDINPYLDKTPRDQGGVESMRATGKECADAVLALLPQIQTAAPENPSLALSEKHVEVGTRWDFTDPKQQEVFRGVYGGLFDRYLADLKPDLAVPLSVLLINGELALAFVPGELFTQHQLDLKAHAPLWPETNITPSFTVPMMAPIRKLFNHRRALLVGYSNDFHLYFPTVLNAAAGGYGGGAATYVGLAAGEKLVLESQIEIGKLTNRLKDFCTPEDFQVVDAKTT